MLTKLFKQLFHRKLVTGISLALIITGGYFGYQGLAKDDDATRYMTAAVEKGTLIVSLSGSGQVSASDQVDIKPKVSGDVVYVGAEKGQEVKAGALLVQVDSRDAQKAVRNAETNLETAQLELEKLLEPVDELDLLKAENNLTQAKESKQEAEDKLSKAYEDGFNTMADTFLDLPGVMTGLENILLGSDFSDNQWNIDYYADKVDSYDSRILQHKEKARLSYQAARHSYDQNFQDYKDISRYSDRTAIEALTEQTYETTKDIAEAVKDIKNFIDFYEDVSTQNNLRIPSLAATHQSSLKSYTSTTNSRLSSLLSVRQTIENSKEAITNAERSIEELELSFEKLKAGADDLDIRAKKISIQQREDALFDARQDLADCYIRAPFDGIVADISAKKGESVSSSAVVTLITKQKIAEITLNEIDIAWVETGQKTNITFDAVEDLNITGEVAEVDTLGTATQGVVTYGAKITFDTQDERVKPGMSLSATIIIEAKQDVLLVQNSAIKHQGDMPYVELVAEAAEFYAPAANISGAAPASDLKARSIQVGLSNDTVTEVIDGLDEGDLVVTQTITSNTAQSQTQSGGEFKGGGQMMRIMH